jgi:hypothetical protein
VHAAHAPSMQASPIGPENGPSSSWLQSAKVVHGAHALSMHTCPFWHRLPGSPVSQPVSGALAQTPFSQACPG